MLNVLKLLIFLNVLFVTGCSLAPLTSPKTGRSLGHKKWLIDGSLAPALGITAGRGFTDNFDAGLIYENQLGSVISAWGKYAIVNQPEGVAFALYGGIFKGSGLGDSQGFFGGPVVSYRSGFFEAYLNSKYNYVSWFYNDSVGSNVSDANLRLNLTEDGNFAYIQSDFGFNFWTSKKFAFNIHGKHFVSLSKDKIDFDDSLVPGLAIIFVFGG